MLTVPRQVHPTSRISQDAAVSDRAVENRREHAIRAKHRRGAAPDVSDPRLYVAESHVGNPHTIPARRDVRAPRDLEWPGRRGFEVTLVFEPLGAELAERDTAGNRTDILATGPGHLKG